MPMTIEVSSAETTNTGIVWHLNCKACHAVLWKHKNKLYHPLNKCAMNGRYFDLEPMTLQETPDRVK